MNHKYLLPLEKQFLKQADPEKAAGMKAYMRGQFDFYGLPTPLRSQLCRNHMKKELPPYSALAGIVKESWKRPQREWQYFAIELVAALKKQWKEELAGLIEFMITHKSWWDSVDNIAGALAGPYFQIFPDRMKKITGKWNRSGDLWLQRSSILFQKAYKQDTDRELLSRYIVRLAGSREFFIQKAIGWALREYSKTDPAWVLDFVKNHSLSPLSRKEALKRIKK
jgi:3-methyladenine DNA glycosylase AlkD